MAHRHQPKEPGPVRGTVNRIGLRRRHVAVVMMLSLVAVSCGGSSDSSSVSTSTTSAQDAASRQTNDELVAELDAMISEVERLTAFVMDTLGSEDGLRAVLAAWERGYGREQLLLLGVDGLELREDGILSRSGEAVEPSGARRGLIELPRQVSGLRSLRSESTDADLESTAAALEDCRYIWRRTSVFEDGSGTYADEIFPITGGALQALLHALFLGVGQDGIEAMIAAARLGPCVEIKTLIVLGAEERRLETLRIEDSCHYVLIDGEVFMGDEVSLPDCRGYVFEQEGSLGEADAEDASSDSDTDDSSETSTTDSVPPAATEPPPPPDPELESQAAMSESARVFRGTADISLTVKSMQNVVGEVEGCTVDLSVESEFALHQDGTVTLLFTDWPLHSGHTEGNPISRQWVYCFAPADEETWGDGKTGPNRRIYSISWIGVGDFVFWSAIEIGTIGSIRVDVSDTQPQGQAVGHATLSIDMDVLGLDLSVTETIEDYQVYVIDFTLDEVP